MKEDLSLFYSSSTLLPLPFSSGEERKEEVEKKTFSPVKDTNKRTLPEEFLLLKFGKNSFTKGAEEGEFFFTPEDAHIVMEEFARRKKDLVIDFEHQSITGEKAPAAGWIKGFAISSPGLVAIVKYWTKEAEKLILNGQYRYFSPTLCFSPDEKKVISIHSVALTNHPALHNIPALAASDLAVEKGEEKEKCLSFPDDGQIKAMQYGALLKKFSFHSLDDLSSYLEKTKVLFREEKIRTALKQGLLTESMRSWAETLLEKDPALFDSWMQCAPRVVPDNAFLEQELPVKENCFADPLEEEIFAMLGLTKKNI